MAVHIKKKSIVRKAIFVILAVFISMNAVACFHAYKFTHFDTAAGNKTQDPGKLSFGQKIRTIFMGVNNPRPENKAVPERPFETILLKSNKILACWLIKSNVHKGTVVLFHGFSGEKSSMLGMAEVFLDLGYNTLLVDFMGSGGSEGNQTTIGYKEAGEVKTAFDYLDSSGERNIILFGTSMGAVAIMKALTDYKIKPSAIVLECPFGTMLETVQSRFRSMHIPSFPMANLLVFWGGVENGFNGFRHNPVQYAKSIICPALVLYGEKDEKVSAKEIETIYKNLNGPKEIAVYPLSGHEDYLLKYKIKWTKDISGFLDKVTAGL